MPDKTLEPASDEAPLLITWPRPGIALLTFNRPARLNALTYDDSGTLTYPHTHTRAGEDALLTYLDEARTLLAARPDEPAWDDALPSGLSNDFEELRWFPLPVTCLTS